MKSELFFLSLLLPIISLASFDLPRPDFLTKSDLQEAYFYNSKSRAPDFVQEYWLCGESQKTQIAEISCSPLNDDEIDGSKRGYLFIKLKIQNKNHFIIPRNGSLRADCTCQARAVRKILSAPNYCFLVQDQNITNKHFFNKETNWTFEKVKSSLGEVRWGHLCEEGLKSTAQTSNKSEETNQ